MVMRNTKYKRENCYIFILVMLGLFFSESQLFSQDISKKPLRQATFEAFNAGNYDKAYQGFSDLLKLYPADPLYKYYSGVSLVQIKKDPEQAVSLLKQSLRTTTITGKIPDDAQYWLGRAQQLAGDFDDAAASYRLYSRQAGRKSSRDLNIADLIQQCTEKTGSLTVSTEKPGSKVQEDNPAPEQAAGAVIMVTNKPEQEPDTLQGKQTVADDYDNMLSEAMRLQVKSDSLYRLADSLRTTLEKTDNKEKAGLNSEILQTEKTAASFQKLADQGFARAQAAMNSKPFTGNSNLQVPLSEEKETAGEKHIDQPPPQPVRDIKIKADTIPAEIVHPEEEDLEQIPGIRNDTTEQRGIMGINSKAVKKVSESFAIFDIGSTPENRNDDKITINPDIPRGLIYRVQVAVFRNPVSPPYFKGITPVYGFKSPGGKLTTYYAGMFRRLPDAEKALAGIRKKGFKDAFISPLFEGKAVSKERAAILEKEWGNKPFVTEVVIDSPAETDTVPPTLSFRVEVMRSMKPVKDDVLEAMKKIAGPRGLESITLQDGNIVYLIGKFITFESAEDYTDLLTRNGYRDAKVSAWLGNKQIPVDTAKQLFESLE